MPLFLAEQIFLLIQDIYSRILLIWKVQGVLFGGRNAEEDSFMK